MRLRTIKLTNNDSIICNLILSKGDMLRSIFKKSKLCDPDTGKECIVISYPMSIFNQYNLTTGEVSQHITKWIPQSDCYVYLLPVDLIVNISVPNKNTSDIYSKCFMIKSESSSSDSDKVQSKRRFNLNNMVTHPTEQ